MLIKVDGKDVAQQLEDGDACAQAAYEDCWIAIIHAVRAASYISVDPGEHSVEITCNVVV